MAAGNTMMSCDFYMKKATVIPITVAFMDPVGGKRGIRTPGASQLNGFQDRRNRPLCHLSGGKSITDILFFQFRSAYFVSILHDKLAGTGAQEHCTEMPEA